jgi:hypothetical protein
MARILSTDWVPRYEDAGYDALIEALAVEGLESDEFLSRLNEAGSQPDMSLEMLMKYIIDRKAAGALGNVDVRGAAYPQHTERPAAPTGLGGSTDGVWFSGPEKNRDAEAETTTLYWYVNGSLKATTQQDVRSNRSGPELSMAKGDVVQVAVVDGVIGWWARLGV